MRPFPQLVLVVSRFSLTTLCYSLDLITTVEVGSAVADPDGGTGARALSSGDRKRHTDSGFSLALVQRMLLILLVAPVATAPQSNEVTLPLCKENSGLFSTHVYSG